MIKNLCTRVFHKKNTFFLKKKLIGQFCSSFWNTLLCTQTIILNSAMHWISKYWSFKFKSSVSRTVLDKKCLKNYLEPVHQRTFDFGQYYCLFQFKSSVLRIIGLPVHPADLKNSISASLTVESQRVLRTIEAPVKLRTTVAPVKLRTIVAPVKSIKNHCSTS